jgi:hypothetical protein
VRGNQGTIEIIDKDLVIPQDEMDEIDEKREMFMDLTTAELAKLELTEEARKLLPPGSLVLISFRFVSFSLF